MILRVNELEKNYGSQTLLDKASLIIKEKDMVALVGQNGTGKTTFIKNIIGEEEFEGGEIELKDDCRIGVMSQEKEFNDLTITFREYLLEKKNRLLQRKVELENAFCDTETIEDSVKYAKLIYDYGVLCKRCEIRGDEKKLNDVLKNLNFSMENFETRICKLSGGEKTKLRLAEVLCEEVDFYILDEPTNHLDFFTIRWLEVEIRRMNKTFLIVSHDRFFLSKIANKVTEIEDKKFVNYSCNYRVYLKKREVHREALGKKYHSTEKERSRLEASVKEKREWAHKNGSKKLKIIANRLEKNANDLEYTPDPKDFDSNFKLEFKNSVLSPEIVFLGSLVNKKFENKVIFENSDFEINNGDKVAIIGKNGAGKSTLLKIFNGGSPDSFEKFKVAKGLEIGYFDQEFANLDLNLSVMDFLWGVNEKLLEHEVISTAIKFGIPKTKINTKIKALSGGEKTRISIVALMLKKTNLLLLDEPTNHLDTNLIESLEKALKEYGGTIIFISHDRFFIDRVSNKVIYINNGKLESYIGNYSQNF